MGNQDKKNNIQNDSLKSQLMNQVIKKNDINNNSNNFSDINVKEKIKNKNKKDFYVDENIKIESLNIIDVLKRLIFGITLGSSSVIPGLSSSSLLGPLNFLDYFREKIYYLIKPKSFINFLFHLLWFLPIIFGIIASFALTFFVFYLIVERGFGVAIVFSALGISIGSAIVYFFIKKVNIPITKKKYNEFLDNGKKPKIRIFIFLSLIILFITMGLISKLAWPAESTGYLTGGISVLSQEDIQKYFNSELYFSKNNFETSIALLLLVAGIFSGFAMLTPGMSSGLMLATFGCWIRGFLGTKVGFTGISIVNVLNNKNEFNLDMAWPIIIVLGIGFIMGLIINVLFFNWINSKNKEIFSLAIFAIYIGSIIGTFISVSSIDYNYFINSSANLGIGISLLFVCPFVVVLSYFLISKFRLIDIDLSFKIK